MQTSELIDALTPLSLDRILAVACQKKRFSSTHCRSCGNKLAAKTVCLDCNEIERGWCEECLQLDETVHAGHQTIIVAPAD